MKRVLSILLTVTLLLTLLPLSALANTGGGTVTTPIDPPPEDPRPQRSPSSPPIRQRTVLRRWNWHPPKPFCGDSTGRAVNWSPNPAMCAFPLWRAP